MSIKSSAYFLKQFDTAVSLTSQMTLYSIIPAFLFLFLMFNILSALVYPNKSRYPLNSDVSPTVAYNPWTSNINITKSLLLSVLSLFASFLYVPFFYGLAIPLKTSIYDVFVYSSNFIMLQILISCFYGLLTVLTRYSIAQFSFCPKIKEPKVGTTSGEITCSRQPWEAAWAIISQTIQDFLLPLLISPFLSVSGFNNRQGVSLYFAPLLYIISIYAGFQS
jgi:hypothetical protein